MKKIAFITAALCGGGQERVTANLVNGLCWNKNYKIYLFTGSVSPDEYKLENQVERIPFLRGKLLKDVISLKKILRDEEIDIAVAMGIYANFVACMSNFFQKTKIIISERNDPVHNKLSKKSKMFRFLFYRFADGYVFQTEQARSFYSMKIQKKGVIIPNPLKENIPYKSNQCHKEIVAVGRLSSQKNYRNLIQAFAMVSKKHPEYLLRIFGKGECETELKTLCKTLKIADKVRFEGFSADVHHAIADSDIYVLSSDFEGMPNALMEAMAMGFAVVSTDCPCGGSASLITSGENGLLVPVNDSDKLAQAIFSLIEDSKLKEKLQKEAVSIRKTCSQVSVK